MREIRDGAWLEQLFHATHAAVRRYVVRRIDADSVDDVVAEVFITAVQRKDDIPAGHEIQWLYRVAMNHISHAHRGHSRIAELDLRLRQRTTADRELDHADWVGTAADIHAALNALPADSAEIIRLTAWEQLTPAEVGQVVGCSEATARVRLHRARKLLRKQLHDPDSGQSIALLPAPSARSI